MQMAARSRIADQKGQSLIQIMLSVGIMGIVMMGFASMMASQTKESRALSDKLAALDLQSLLTASLADGSVCAYVMNYPAVKYFDSTKLSANSPQTIVLPNSTAAPATLYASVNAGAPPTPGAIVARANTLASPSSNTLKVQAISLQITGGGAGTYTGNWLVSFDPATTVRPLKPVSVATTLSVDDTSNPTQAKITGCQGMKSSLDYATTKDMPSMFPRKSNDTPFDCPAGYVVTGVAMAGMNVTPDATIRYIRCTKLK